MSRVRKPGKYTNTNEKSPWAVGKIKRLKAEKTDYTKADTLTSWLFLKYDMSYKTFSRKSKAKKDSLREEYVRDTGREYPSRQRKESADMEWDIEERDAYNLLSEIGVPFDLMGEPIGIGDGY